MAHAAALTNSIRFPRADTHEAEYALAARRFAETGKFPASLECAITQDLMHDPVMTCEGNTYERSEITKWLATNNTDPCIGTALRELNLIENRTVKSQIQAFRAAVAALGPEVAARLPQPPRAGLTAAAAPLDSFVRTPQTPPAQTAPRRVQPEILPRPDRNQTMPPRAVPHFKTRVAYAPRYGLTLTTFAKAKAAALRCHNDVAAYQSVIGGYLEVKRQKEYARLPYQTNRTEYRYSRKDIRLYNHLMHKVETLSASIACSKSQRVNWSLAVNPFRRQLYSELYQNNELVRAFGGSLPGGRMALPEMDDWTLGIKRRNRFSLPFDMRKFQTANDKAPTDLLGDVHTALLIDDSGSMRLPASYNSRQTRWDEVRDLLGQIGPLLARYADPDFHRYDSLDNDDYKRTQLRTTHTQGFDLHFLHHPNPVQGLRTPAEVMNLFNNVQPSYNTPTGQRINDILDAYMSTLRFERNLKPLNLVVLTDGCSNDQPQEILDRAIEEHVSHVVQRGHPGHQLGIEFLQVGNDPSASDQLDELEETVDQHHRNLNCDVVGVTHMATANAEPLTAESLTKMMVQGIEAREMGYHRDFRARKQATARARRNRQWQRDPGY